MTIRLHYSPLSPHGRRVRMTVLELGLPVELHVVDFAKGDNRAPAYVAKNPMGKVPTLEDGDFVLWESHAIMAYLADQKPGSTLYPADTKRRADVNRWLFWESAHFGAAAAMLINERVIKVHMMKQQPDATLVALGEQNFKRYAAVLDTQLQDREFVAGPLSIADLSMASVLMYQDAAKLDIEPFANLKAWAKRMQARDSWTNSAT